MLTHSNGGNDGANAIVTAQGVESPATVDVSVGVAVEDLPFTLDIDIGLSSPMVGVSSVVVTGLPEDAILESATEGLLLPREDGSYLLDMESLAGLMVTPPQHFSGDLAGMEIVVTTTEGVSSAPVPFSVSVLSIYDAPYPGTSDGHEGIANDMAHLGENLLAVRDVDDPTDAIVYEVTELPQFGTLFLGNSALNLGETFSQFDIDNGILTYEKVDPEIDSGTYVTGLGNQQNSDPVSRWSDVDIYAFSGGNAPHVSGEGQLDLSRSDNSLVSFTAQGVGVFGDTTAAADAHLGADSEVVGSGSLAIQFRADVSAARIDLSINSAEGPCAWESFNTDGQLVGTGTIDGAWDNDSASAAVQASDGALFRYLVIHANSNSDDSAGGIYVRGIEYDVDHAQNADTFSFRPEDGQQLALASLEYVEPGYSIVDGEAIFNIAVMQDFSS